MGRIKLTLPELKKLRVEVSEDVAIAIDSDSHCLVSVSGGNASAAMLFRCLEWFGRKRVSAVFADTNSEHPDLYRFLAEVEKKSGVEIVMLDQGKNIWDVFDSEHRMKIPKFYTCKASLELKREPLIKYTESLGPNVVTAVGLDSTEPERIAGVLQAVKSGFIFPLAVRPYLYECDFRTILESHGIQLSTLYEEGFVHNNCGGGCILAGIGQWAHHYKTHKKRFAEDEAREKVFFEKHGFSVLRDRSGGKTKPFTLSQLRESIESGKTYKVMNTPVCGCAVD